MNYKTKEPFLILITIVAIFAGAFTSGGILHAQYNYGQCNYHAYKDCVGSSVYWFDSCYNRQDLSQDCATLGQTCQYGQCITKIQPIYTAHYKASCYNNDLYWYDSLGVVNSLHTNCQDTNSCTIDSCSETKCSNILKCDRSTCVTDSDDFNNFCGSGGSVSNCGNGTCEANLGESSANCIADCYASVQNNLMISFVAKKDVSSQQWEKNVQVEQDSNVYFLIAVNNNSDIDANNVNISCNIPPEIFLLGNLKVNDIPVSGDIVAGINIGGIPAKNSKSITFEGKAQAFSNQEQKQAIATVSSGGSPQMDSVNLDFNPNGSSIAAVSETADNSGIMGFLKRWYLWILSAIVLVFLFVIVFRRISSNA